MIQELIDEMFRTGQMKNVFADIEICRRYAEKKDDLRENYLTRRIKYNLNSIIHSLIQFDKFEKGKRDMFIDEFEEEAYEIVAHHESMLARFNAIIKYSTWMFERFTNTSITNLSEVLHYIGLIHPVNEEEKMFLSLDWYSYLDAAFKSRSDDSKLKAYIENSIVKFQIFTNEKSAIFNHDSIPVLKFESNMFTECPLVWVHSKQYFAVCFIYLLKYLELLSNYCSMMYFCSSFYNEFKEKSQIEQSFNKEIEILPEENTLGIIRVLSEIQTVSVNCLNIAKFKF